MRELKFRAWDKQNNKMTTVWSIGWKAWDSPDEVLNYVEIQRDGAEKVFDHEVILMQFTGLLDKNTNQEAYEGDIAVDEHGQRFLIEWDFALLARLSEIWFGIIGNIHENPELLEAL